MVKCGQILEHKAESICGLDICCHECDHKCESACKNERESCEYLRADDETNTQTTSLTPNKEKFLNKNTDFLKEIKDFQVKYDKMKDQEKILRDKLKVAMKEFNITDFENDFIKISMSAPYTKHSIDIKKLKAEQPDIAKKYTVESEVAGKLTITPKIEEKRLNN